MNIILNTFEFFFSNFPTFKKILFPMKIQDYNRETLSSITRKILEADIEHCYKKKSFEFI